MWALLPVAASASIATAIAVGCSKGRQETRVRPSNKSVRSTLPGGTASSRASRKSQRSSKSAKSKRDSASKSSKKGIKSTAAPGKAGLAKPSAPASAGSIKEAKTQSSRRSKRSSSSRSSKVVVPKSARSKKSSSSSGSKRSNREKKAEVAGGAVPAPKKVVIPVVPRMELKMEPKELHYKAARGGMQNMVIVNTSDQRRAIKVKCSDNLIYRVNPVYAFVEPGASVRVDVLRQSGTPKVDKIVIVASEASKEDTNAFAVCGRLGAHTEMMVLPLIAQGAE